MLPHEFQVATRKRNETKKRCIWVALETSEKQQVESISDQDHELYALYSSGRLYWMNSRDELCKLEGQVNCRKYTIETSCLIFADLPKLKHYVFKPQHIQVGPGSKSVKGIDITEQ
jgi:hypothetical protein